MKCLYHKCSHNSSENDCDFITFPTNNCAQKIWKRYADVRFEDLTKVLEPRLCSCHFDGSFDYPIPHYMSTKRTFTEQDNEPKPKYSKYEFLDENEAETTIFLNEWLLDSSVEYLGDFGHDGSQGRDGADKNSKKSQESLNGSLSSVEYLNDIEYVDSPSSEKANDTGKSNVVNGFMVDSHTENCEIQELQIVSLFGIAGNNNELSYSELLDLDDNLFSTPKTKKKNNSSTVHPDNFCVIKIENVTNDKSIIEQNPLIHEEVTPSRLQEIRTLKEENKSMKTKIAVLTKRLINMNLKFEFAFIENSDEKVFLHTGLPNKHIFDVVFGLMSRFDFDYAMGWKVTIPQKTQFLMTLIKLRMDLRYFDIKQRFVVSIATISNIFRTWVFAMHEILFVQLMKQIPTRFKNNECLPAAFKALVDCRIILDCTEFFVDRPQKMSNQKAVYSPYKHHVTAKGLIGIAPNGVITYSSYLYPGSLSDKKIVQHCGITDQLELGDNVLADKGFLIRDDLPYGLNLNVPPFLSTPQFTSQQVRLTEFYARARVHVERAVNRVKNFRILHYLPAEFFPIANEIFQVCVALSNFQYPLIREVASDF